MDEPSAADRSASLSYGPNRSIALAIAGLALVVAVLTALTTDPVGRIIPGIAVLVLAALAVTDLVFAPRLHATADSLTIRTPAHRGRYAWRDIDSIVVDQKPHLGLASRSLEIEAQGQLIVFSRRALGAEPADVQVVLTGFRNAGIG